MLAGGVVGIIGPLKNCERAGATRPATAKKRRMRFTNASEVPISMNEIKLSD